MIVVNAVIRKKKVGFALEINLLRREDATAAEWKFAKLFEAAFEGVSDTVAQANELPPEKYKKTRIDIPQPQKGRE